MQSLNLKKLNNVAVKEEYQVKISNMFAALESYGGGDDDGGGGGMMMWIPVGLGKVLLESI
jgi:hypothetical protein